MTAHPFLPFALPDIGEAEIAEVVDTLRSGWITTGPKTRRFEEDFAAWLGEPALHALAVNSATAGLHLALEALGIGPGDEVITTTHTFTATAEVVRYLGADVVLVDIDPAMTRLARTLAPQIRVNGVAPGFIAGRWTQNGLGDRYEAIKEAYIRTLPLAQVCTPEGIAAHWAEIIDRTGETVPQSGGEQSAVVMAALAKIGGLG